MRLYNKHICREVSGNLPATQGASNSGLTEPAIRGAGSNVKRRGQPFQKGTSFFWAAIFVKTLLYGYSITCGYYGSANFGINFGQFYSLHRAKVPVTLLLRMRETYQKRMKINEIIFIRTIKNPLKYQRMSTVHASDVPLAYSACA